MIRPTPEWTRNGWNWLLVSVSLVLGGILCSGCASDAADWKPGDQDKIRKLVSEISDARTNKEAWPRIFSESATPTADWWKQTQDVSFVVADIALDGDQAQVSMDLENHFGEVQKTVQWQCTRSGDDWLLSAVPLE